MSFLICASLRRPDIHHLSRTRNRNFFTEEINNSGMLAQNIKEEAQKITEKIH